MDENKPTCSFCGKATRPLVEGRRGAFICHGCAAFTHQIAAYAADRTHQGIRRRSLLRFGIRDLLWAMVVVGLAIGWWIDQTDLRLGLRRATRIIEEMEGARESNWHQLNQARKAYAYLERYADSLGEDARQQRALVTEYHARLEKCQADSAKDD